MVTVVSGVPRSGTSLMMQMLAAGGMPVFTDGIRSADANNPRGYYELESVKVLSQKPDLLDKASGKVVKIISWLLPSLPPQHEYRVVFMCRPLEEVAASQNHMLERLGKDVPTTPTSSVIAAFEQHLTRTRSWLSQQPNIKVEYVDYPDILERPEEQTAAICEFLGRKLDCAAMKGKIEQSLYRERSRSCSTASTNN